KADHATTSGHFGKDRAQLPVAEPARLRQRVPRSYGRVEHVEVDRDVERVRLRDRSTHDFGRTALEHIKRRGPSPTERAQSVHLGAVDVAKPEGGDRTDERQLRQTS